MADNLPQVDDWEDDPADWQDEVAVPDETSVSSTPYGPETRPPIPEHLRPSGFGNIRDAAEVMGISLPSEKQVRGAVASLAQGPALSWADEAAGMLAKRDQAIRNFVLGRTEVDPNWAYRNAREKFRGVEREFREENPKTALGLTVTGGAVLGGPVQGVGKGLARLVPGAVEGAIAGAGSAEEAEDMGYGAAVGAPLGVAGQVAGELLGEGARAAGRLATGWYQPSAAAQSLQRRGVTDLTLGQMVPDSWAAQAEEAGTSVAGIGPALKAQREAGRAGWQQAVMREAVPPGGTRPSAADTISDRLAQAYDEFGGAYAQVRGHPIVPEAVGQLADAADNPSVLATDETRAAVRRFIRNQMTLLRPDADGMVSSDQVLAARSAIREAVRDSDDPAVRRLMQTAADDLTNLLDAQLPAQAANVLRTTDARYGAYKVVEDAVRRGGDQTGGFTPSQLSSAVRSSMQPGAYARGEGGALRELARAGKETLDVQVPNTGSRLLAAGPVPYITGPLSYAANLPGPKAFLTGQTGAQEALRTGIERSGIGRYANVAQQAGVSASVPALQSTMQDRGARSDSELIGSLLTENPAALGPYAQTLQQAQADQRLAVVHYVLQQRDPEYRQLLEQARDARR